MNDITALMATIKAAAEKATALNLDTAQEIRGEDGGIECPTCGGEGYVGAERDYCNIDSVALGVQFYGIGEHHGAAEEYFRKASPANVKALVEALEARDKQIIQLQQKCEIDPRTHAIIDLEERIAELTEFLSHIKRCLVKNREYAPVSHEEIDTLLGIRADGKGVTQ